MSDGTGKVTALLNDMFPAPVDDPDPSFPERFGEILMQSAAHQAVHRNDKFCRDGMRGHVIEHLRAGATMTVAERAWLIYVLSKLDDLPHESKGRPVEGHALAMFRLSLASFVVGDERSNPDRKVTERLRAAAETLCVSYEKVRAAYYAKDFRAMCDRLNSRGFIYRVLNGKTVAD